MSQNNQNNWDMPEPIFRNSTGELVSPKDAVADEPEHITLDPASPAADPVIPDDPLATLYAPPDDAVAARSPDPPREAAPIDLKPQPFISEEFTAEQIVVEASTPKPKKSGRSVFFALGFLMVLAIVAAAAGLVYYLFFMARPNTSGF